MADGAAQDLLERASSRPSPSSQKAKIRLAPTIRDEARGTLEWMRIDDKLTERPDFVVGDFVDLSKNKIRNVFSTQNLERYLLSRRNWTRAIRCLGR